MLGGGEDPGLGRHADHLDGVGLLEAETGEYCQCETVHHVWSGATPGGLKSYMCVPDQLSGTWDSRRYQEMGNLTILTDDASVGAWGFPRKV